MSEFLERWDRRLLTYMALDIQGASEVNSGSWTLKPSGKNRLALGVHQWNVLVFGPKTFDCWLPGKYTEQRYAFAHWPNAEFRYKSPVAGGFWIEKLREDQLVGVLDALAEAHLGEIRRIAAQVGERCNSAIHHQWETQDDLAAMTGIDLRQPSYLRR